MCLRRVRSHKEGISNIDFRSKQDIDNIRLFKPWQSPKEFGTMGYRNYKIPIKKFKNLFSPTNEINTQKDIVNEFPDPKYFTTAQFYKKNNILLKRKTFFNNDRVANLEESFKGKDIFNGDSMNIAEIMRTRKGKYIDNLSFNLRENMKESFRPEDHKIEKEKKEKLVEYKDKCNKNTTQETQLVKINSYIEKEKEVNLKKIEEIRQAIRRRYGNRKNIYKVFQLWAKTFPNKITVYDAYKMINSLSIPINYNETKVFIASGSFFGNEYLNLEEFSSLIYNPVKIDKGNDDNKFLYEEKEQEPLKKNIILKNKIQATANNVQKLKDFISERIMVLNKKIKELCKEKYTFKEDDVNKTNHTNFNLVDYDKFLKGILSLKPSENIGKEEYIKILFNDYKDKNDLVNMKFFGQNLFEKNTKDFLTIIKDRNVETCKEQYNIKAKKLQNYFNENYGKIKPLFLKKKLDLDNQMKEKVILKEKERMEENKLENQLNSTIPSTKWLHHIYDNRKEHYNILNRVEHSFSAKPTFKQNSLKCNTRFGAAPPWKNTAEILIGDEKCATYVNEKDRFNIIKDISKEDKKLKNLLDLGRQNRIKTAIQKAENNIFMKNYLKEEKDIYSDMKKNQRIAIYNENSKNKNFVIE